MESTLLWVCLMFLVKCTYTQFCGDQGSICTCTSGWIICENGVTTDNILDILPETILGKYDHLLIHAQSCQDLIGLRQLMTTKGFKQLEVLIPSHCHFSTLPPPNRNQFEDHSDEFYDDYGRIDSDNHVIYVEGPLGIVALTMVALIFAGACGWSVKAKKYRSIITYCQQKVRYTLFISKEFNELILAGNYLTLTKTGG